MFGHQDDPKPTTNDNQSTALLTADTGIVLPAATPLDAPSDTSVIPSTPVPSVAVSTPATAPAVPAVGDNTLLDIKQQALQQLSPLVGHLEQTPEEKFRTTMMMIQAADNQDLLKAAYDAAQAITDEKARAQALLDVINEINYFTQHKA